MKKFILVILLTTCLTNIFSQEKNELQFMIDERYHYFDVIETDFNMSWRFLILPPDENSFGFVDISYGVAYGFVPGFYYIGIAGDVALGFDWFTIFTDNDSGNQFGLSLGARIYNLFQIANFRIWPFFGCDLLPIVLLSPYAGIELSYKIVGLEYAYYLPINNESLTRHRVAIKFHLPKKL